MNIFVKPKAGLKIRRPDTQTILADEGESVPNNNFWARRVLDKDVEVVDEPKQKQKPQTDLVAEAPAEEAAQETKAKKGRG